MPPKRYQAPRVPAPMKKGKADKKRPEGMTNMEWVFDIQRRHMENVSRRLREKNSKLRRAAEAQTEKRATTMEGMAAPI